MSQLQPEGTITPYQGYALLVTTVIGVEVIAFPRLISKEVGPDGIWIIFISGLITILLVYLMTRLCQQFPQQSITQFVPRILGSKHSPRLGRLLSAPLMLLLLISWLGIVAMITRSFGEVMVSAVLVETPIEFIMGTLCAIGAIVTSNRPEILARYAEFLLPFLYPPILLILFAVIQEGDWLNLLPLFQVNWHQVFKGLLHSLATFGGIKVILVFMAFYQQPQRAMHSHISAMVIIMIGYLGTFLSALSIFGKDEIVHLLWPTLEVVKQLRIPGGILERVESAVLVVWMVAVFTSITAMLGASVQLIISALRLQEHYRKWAALLGALIVYIVGILPSTVNQLFLWTYRVELLGVSIALVLPLFLFVVLKIRGGKGEIEQDEQPSV